MSGTQFGMDFNPVPDWLRVTSNTGQNLRINVDTGLVQLDVPLAYQAGDANFGDAPVDIAVAYSNNVPGALTTVLRGVDIGQSPDLLVVHSNPNGGTLQTSLSLPFDASLLSYDISGLTGIPYFAATPLGGVSLLYSGVTLIGPIGSNSPIIAISAAMPSVPEPSGLLLAGLGLATWLRRRLT